MTSGPAQEDPDAPSPAELEAARVLFAQECRFVAASATIPQLPPETLPEVAFVGRSNVGKSSLVNALTGRKTLARTSNTPGRTQEVIFFDLGGRLMLVDLPGYGYAKVSKAKQAIWTDTLFAYLRGRPTLQRVSMLIDGRHGLKELDTEAMDLLDRAALSYQVVLTKADKVKPAELAAMIDKTTKALSRRPAAHPVVVATSSETGAGIPELRVELARFANPA
ncbi:ribosome biogenesis GTP-binding protein YihA/YsxC [Thalassobaculum sp.]|uniref:ribosome biogenesis GTP-binding protein YihA/YsxC n=1 Tax=Thalassobaculum sp. TaxID=2022740 RepID=UPI003B5BEE7E